MDIVDNDVALRLHIQKLLLQYALKHLTIDYIEYTFAEVSQLLSSTLNLVPLEDPTFISLAIEPFDALYQTFKLGHQTAYDETWKVDVESRQLLTGRLLNLGKSGELPSNLCWKFENETAVTDPSRPLSPVLTTQAIRQTPKLGNLTSHNSTMNSTSSKHDLFDLTKIKPVAEHSIKEVIFSSLERDQLLGVRPSLDTEMRQAITTLLTQILVAQPRPKTSGTGEEYTSSMVSGFMRDDSPTMLDLHRRMSPPIFPCHMASPSALGPRKPSDIRSLGITNDMVAEEEVEDIATEHMLLVGGWSVLEPPAISQTDTPSLEGGSQSSEVDELFALTPPQQPFFKSSSYLMDEILIPRSNKPGGGNRENKSANSEQSLGTFLTPMLPPVPVMVDVNPIALSSRNSPPVSISMMGQPPSPSGSLPNPSDIILNSDREDIGLNALIAKLCAPLNGQQAEDLILNERMEEKETIMMDVPKLKEPHIHPPSPSCPPLPTLACSLLCVKKNNNQQGMPPIPVPTVACVSKATGMQSLNIELTWRPFNFGTSVPRTEELLDVEYHPELDPQVAGCSTRELNRIIDDQVPVVNERSGAELLVDAAVNWSMTLGEDCSRYNPVLTRAERRRLALHKDHDNLDGSDGVEYTTAQKTQSGPRFEEPEDDIGSPVRPSKRRRKEPDLIGDRAFISTALDPSPELGSATTHSGSNTFSFQALNSPKRDDLQSMPFWNAEPSLDGDGFALNGFGELMEPELWTAENMEYHATPPNRKPAVGVPALALESEEINIVTVHSMENPSISEPRLMSAEPIVYSHPIQPPAPQAKITTSFHDDIRYLERMTAQQSLLAFMKLRGKHISDLPMPPSSPPPVPEVLIDRPPTLPRGVPNELIDATITFPHDWSNPSIRYKYIASMDFIQKTIMLSHLNSSECNIELVERDASETRGADLIVDVDTVIIYTPLAPLSITGDQLAERISLLSWDYSNVVIVFEAFSPSTTFRRDRSGVTIAPYAFPPAIIKAVKKLKRTLTIMESIDPADGSTSKCHETVVKYAYARNVSEAARFARVVGDIVGCSVERDWLTDEYEEDEKDLIQVRGMNVFAAASILHYIDLTTFVEMDPQERFDVFSCLVGERRMAILNEEIATRLAIIASSSSPISDHESAVTQVQDSENSVYVEPYEDYGDPCDPEITKSHWDDWSAYSNRNRGAREIDTVPIEILNPDADT